jgi:hypothetical protein
LARGRGIDFNSKSRRSDVRIRLTRKHGCKPKAVRSYREAEAVEASESETHGEAKTFQDYVIEEGKI